MHLTDKYRPKNFKGLIGQNLIKTILENSITQNKIAPTYIFRGKKGTGKTSTARIFAKSLNCLNSDKPSINPCSKCANCKSITNGTNLDVKEIDAATHNGVDSIRELVENANLTPINSRYKITILDEAHQLTKHAQNAALKLFEEPPKNNIFILCTTEVKKLLPTIISRSILLNFQPIAKKHLSVLLSFIAKKEAIQINSKSIDTIINYHNGSVRDSINSLNLYSLSETKNIEKILGIIPQGDVQALAEIIATKNTVEAVKFVKSLEKEPEVIIQQLIRFFTDSLINNTTDNYQKTTKYLNILLEKERQLYTTTSKEVVLDIAISNLCMQV